MEKNSVNYKYLVRSPRDIDWGITVDTVGSEPIPPNYPVYPPRTGHPDAFYFTPSRGRVLDSYQLLYITHGKGYFYTSPDTFIEIKEGDILILQPHVWHSYFPDKKTGWQEYWIGFQGINMDSRFQNNFFAKDQIVYHIGVQDSIVKLYEQAIQVAMEEKAACQQYLAGIANLILGMTMYYSQNYEFDNKATEQISKAKVFIRENLLKGIGPEEVADSLHMSYSWFRKLFKEYTGLSPAHYIQELKIQQAKDLLATTQRSTKEIAYYLTFDDIPYFTKVFKKYTGYTPQSYRKKFGREYIHTLLLRCRIAHSKQKEVALFYSLKLFHHKVISSRQQFRLAHSILICHFFYALFSSLKCTAVFSHAIYRSNRQIKCRTGIRRNCE